MPFCSVRCLFVTSLTNRFDLYLTPTLTGEEAPAKTSKPTRAALITLRAYSPPALICTSVVEELGGLVTVIHADSTST